MSLPIKIRKTREKAGISQQNLADALGMHRSNYIKLETGRGRITVKMLQKLASIPELQLSEEKVLAWYIIENFSGEAIELAYKLIKENKK